MVVLRNTSIGCGHRHGFAPTRKTCTHNYVCIRVCVREREPKIRPERPLSGIPYIRCECSCLKGSDHRVERSSRWQQFDRTVHAFCARLLPCALTVSGNQLRRRMLLRVRLAAALAWRADAPCTPRCAGKIVGTVHGEERGGNRRPGLPRGFEVCNRKRVGTRAIFLSGAFGLHFEAHVWDCRREWLLSGRSLCSIFVEGATSADSSVKNGYSNSLAAGCRIAIIDDYANALNSWSCFQQEYCLASSSLTVDFHLAFKHFPVPSSTPVSQEYS